MRTLYLSYTGKLFPFNQSRPSFLFKYPFSFFSAPLTPSCSSLSIYLSIYLLTPLFVYFPVFSFYITAPLPFLCSSSSFLPLFSPLTPTFFLAPLSLFYVPSLLFPFPSLCLYFQLTPLSSTHQQFFSLFPTRSFSFPSLYPAPFYFSTFLS
uniref:Uncharacterized protein n=1 Tax=Octopus bimaculoides TaxID=37653 RepID=A0A0L8G5K5_OCTBM